MPSLAGFAAFAKRVGAVPRVPPVPLENEEADELADRFEERVAILEYDGGWTRVEAERLARLEVYGTAAIRNSISAD
jgi:hypothetical protein